LAIRLAALPGTRDTPVESNLDYGISQAWSTPIKRVNLLESGVVPAALHQWLENFADSPKFVSGPLSDYFEAKKLFIRYDVSIFASPAEPELARIKDILISQADQYARETIVDPLPEHDKYAYLWFVVQGPNNETEAVRPHYHEPGDFAWVYYLSVPSNNSGSLVMFDPRGMIERGGRALPRHEATIEYVPRRGDLLILPRYVMHQTTTNTDVGPRKVIAGVLAYERPRKEKAPFLLEK
jgi:hypothetical protein